MSQSRNPEHTGWFLATTALESFWDTSMPMVFLGEWCRRYRRRSYWTSLDAKVLPCIWETGQSVEDAHRQVRGVYENALMALADAMNKIHGVRCRQRYWRILLGPWLLEYISSAYDKYSSLVDAFDRYPALTSYVLSPAEFIVPRDTYEAERLLSEDSYNLQLYSRLFTALGKSFPEKRWECETRPLEYSDASIYTKSLKLKMAESFSYMVYRLLSGKDAIVLRNAYFSGVAVFKLIAMTKGKVCVGYVRRFQIPLFPVDRVLRSKLKDMVPGGDRFSSLLPGLISSDMPQCFLEGYGAVNAEAGRIRPGKPGAIFSANSWFYDEAFKAWAGASVQKGTMLLGTQHGGNYGSIKYHPTEDHELSITDRFYSWGWDRPEDPAKVIPMPASKLSVRRRLGADPQKDGILFVSTIYPRYSAGVSPRHIKFSEYLLWQMRFADAVLPHIRGKIRVRPHRDDYGWDIAARWKDRFPDVAMESWDIPFWNSLRNCRIYVCDHIATTFFESLAAERPTLLFWDPEAEVVRAEAEPYYDELRTVGILHDTPESAAATLNAVYRDVASWWKDPSRREALRRFSRRFARTSSHAIRDWAAEFTGTPG